MVEDVYELRPAPRSAPCPARVFLLGTSYSSHRGQSLAALAHLKGALVVWEFPFRDLVDPLAFAPRNR